MKQWECIVCGWIYDEKIGDPDSGIEPGTKFEDIPDDWLCPECGVGKDDFELVEVAEPTAVSAPSIPTATQSGDPIVIIGSGLAGYGLLKEIRKHDVFTPITLICSDDGRSYSKPALSTGYTKNTSADDLSHGSAAEMAIQHNASILTMIRVSGIDTKAQTLSLNEGTGTLRYGKLVLALGADCIEPPIGGDATDHIYSVNDLMDFGKFQAAVEHHKAKKICIIGAGLIGCEYANDLLNGGFSVESVDPLATCLPTLLPEAAGNAVRRGLEEKGAKFHFARLAAEVNFVDGGISVSLDDGSSIEADLVLSAVGVRPRTHLAAEAGIEIKRGICTNATLETSAANVYALGDCAEVEGLVMVYVAPLVAGAHALARTLTGTPTEVHYPAMPVAIKTPACPVVVSPPPHDADGEWIITKEDGNSVQAEFENPQGELLGFALTGEFVGERSQLAQQLPDLLG